MGTVLQISDEDNVLRRVPTLLQHYVKPDGTISRMAFKPKRGDNGLSVDLERLSSFEKATNGDRSFRLLKVNVGTIRHDINDGIDVKHDPVPDNLAHSLIVGNITRGKQGELLRIAGEVFAEEV